MSATHRPEYPESTDFDDLVSQSAEEFLARRQEIMERMVADMREKTQSVPKQLLTSA